MRLKELRMLVRLTESMADDTIVNVQFCEYTSDNERIESIEIIDDGESEYIELGIRGNAYKTEYEREEPAVTSKRLGGDIRNKIIDALQQTGNNRKKAAEILGCSERSLYRWILQYEIEL